MFKRARTLLSFALALALPLLPLWHSWSHAEEDLRASRAVCAEQGRGQQHWHRTVAPADVCEACHALSQQALLLSPATLPQADWVSAEALARAWRGPASFEFLYFDHRGPPVQA